MFQLYPFAVPVEELQELVGSKKWSLLRRAKKEDFTSVEEHLADREEPQPKVAEVIKCLLEGTPLDPTWGVQFGVILDWLCSLFGKSLQCREIGSSEWVDRVDKAIRTAGVPNTVFGLSRMLISRGSPLPFAGDIPMCIGYLTADEVRKATASFQKAKYKALREDVRPSVAEVRSWLSYADTMGWGLVGFYHH
jgi:hypothetical protein